MGDSIIKDITQIDGVTIRAFPGVTIGKLALLFSKGTISVENYDYLILHVGTNNIANRNTYEEIISDYGNLLGIIRKIKINLRIIVSSILPRPIDHSITDGMIKQVNNYLKHRMSRDLNFTFVCSYKAVSKFGTFRRYLFAKLDKGLHLNTEGSNRLRFFFIRVISTID